MIREMQKESITVSKENKKRYIIIGICVAFFVIAICAGTWYLLNREHTVFIKPENDKTAVSGAPDIETGYNGYGKVHVTDGYSVSLCGLLKDNDGAVDVYLTNPEDNQVWVKLLILDKEGNTLGQTGIVKQGQYVKSVFLDEPLIQNETEVTLKLLGYSPDDYQSKGTVQLNTKIHK